MEAMDTRSDSRLVVYAALAGNLLIAATKFAAAGFTGSSAMLSEGVHSVVDTGNQALLLYGHHRASLPPDEAHPLGYSRELYFWSFIVALLVFALGAGVSVYEGVQHILHPHRVEDIVVNYVVLGVSFVFEFATWLVALKHFRESKGNVGYLRAIRRSKDPMVFTVLFEDSAALIGLFIAFAGIFMAQALDAPRLDGVASIGIGIVLATTALLLARETKGLLIGEAASRRVQRAIVEIAEQDPDVQAVNDVLTDHLGPQQIIVAISAEFEDHLTAPQIEACVLRLEKALAERHPEIIAVFIKPQSARTWKARKGKI